MAICPRGHNSIADDFCDACGRPIAPQSASAPQQTRAYTGGAEYPAAPAEPCPVCHTPRDGATRFCEACGHEFGTPYDPGFGWRPGPGNYPASGDYAEPQPPATGYQEQPSGQSGAQGYGQYVPQTSPPAGYPPATSQSAGTYLDPTYTDEWGGGTVVGSGPVVPPPLPPQAPPQAPPMVPADFHPGPAPQRTSYVWTVLVTADAEYFERVVSQGGPDAHAMRFPPYHETWAVALEGDRMRVGRRRAGGSGGDAPEIDLSGPPSDPGISHLHVVLMSRADGSWQLVDPGSTNGTTLNGGKRAIEFNVPVDLHDGDRIHVGAWTTLEVRLRSL